MIESESQEMAKPEREKLQDAVPLDWCRERVTAFLDAKMWQSKLNKEVETLADYMRQFMKQEGKRYGTLDGKPVVHRSPQTDANGNVKLAVQRLIKENPELVEPFMEARIVHELDVDAFRAAHPDVAADYEIWMFGVEK